MHMLYDSDTYSVMHMMAHTAVADTQAPGAALAPSTTPRAGAPVRHGFEIVDKRLGKEIYLDGPWAELFQRHIAAWQQRTPTQEEVEDTLEQYAELANNPVVMH